MKRVVTYLVLLIFAVLVLGCSPEVGSVEWCEEMDKTPKGEWSMNDVSTYAENCVFRKTEGN